MKEGNILEKFCFIKCDQREIDHFVGIYKNEDFNEGKPTVPERRSTEFGEFVFVFNLKANMPPISETDRTLCFYYFKRKEDYMNRIFQIIFFKCL